MPKLRLSNAVIALGLACVALPAMATTPFSLGFWKFRLDDGVTFRMELFSDTKRATSNSIIDIQNFAYSDPGDTLAPFTATLLPSGTDFNPSGPGTDNLLLNAKSTTLPHLGAGGYAFIFNENEWVASSPPALVKYQVFYDGGQYKGCYLEPDGTQECLGVSAVPEPASWALMIAGFALVGGALRQRRGWGAQVG